MGAPARRVRRRRAGHGLQRPPGRRPGPRGRRGAHAARRAARLAGRGRRGLRARRALPRPRPPPGRRRRRPWAEIGTWFAAQAAELRARMGFALALTVWETIAWRSTYRWPRERGYRKRVLAAADRFLPATERARDALLLEGVAPERITVSPPGIDLDHFASAPGPSQPPAKHRILSAGRLVWEKGHQDVLRAFAALRRVLAGTVHTDVELLVVGDGPSASAWSAMRASSASPTASSSAPPSPTTPCRRSTPRPPRSCSRACPRAGGRSSSAWSSSRPSPPARRSSPARRARSPRSSAPTGRSSPPATGSASPRRWATRSPARRRRAPRSTARALSASPSAAAAERLRAIYAELLARGALAEAPGERVAVAVAHRGRERAPALGEGERLEEEDGEDEPAAQRAQRARQRQVALGDRDRVAHAVVQGVRGGALAAGRGRHAVPRERSGTNQISKPAARARQLQSTSST